jgi:hypothetical protein
VDDFDDGDGSSASDGDGKLYGIIKSQKNHKKPQISGNSFLVEVICVQSQATSFFRCDVTPPSFHRKPYAYV